MTLTDTLFSHIFPNNQPSVLWLSVPLSVSGYLYLGESRVLLANALSLALAAAVSARCYDKPAGKVHLPVWALALSAVSLSLVFGGLQWWPLLQAAAIVPSLLAVDHLSSRDRPAKSRSMHSRRSARQHTPFHSHMEEQAERAAAAAAAHSPANPFPSDVDTLQMAITSGPSDYHDGLASPMLLSETALSERTYPGELRELYTRPKEEQMGAKWAHGDAGTAIPVASSVATARQVEEEQRMTVLLRGGLPDSVQTLAFCGARKERSIRLLNVNNYPVLWAMKSPNKDRRWIHANTPYGMLRPAESVMLSFSIDRSAPAFSSRISFDFTAALRPSFNFDDFISAAKIQQDLSVTYNM